MPTNSGNAALRRKLFLALILVTLCVVAVFAYYENRPWKVPEEAKLRPNPIQPSALALAAGRTMYMDKCTQCHGQTGKGDGPDAASYYPSPTSLVDANHMNSVTDGEIFYQISEGRKPMPAFKRKLTEEQRWQLVLYVRSFAPAAPASH
ncbi:MAG TPA: c-type cytochrome [Candidatus Acidoferrum sp.]|nr:c-type cytochrome [Candidatus Acidoferrum sp.]